jgi:GAF domain-containing protein
VAEDAELRRELESAHATVATQAIQIHRLEQEAQRRSGLGALRELMQLSTVVSVTVGQSPYRALLDGIVHAARRLFDAGAASIALLDHSANELVFEAATGNGEDVVGLRFPAHQGIAGWVVVTGEAIASSDVRRDPRFAKEFAESTGYVPQSIMAVPLIVQEEVEGVLEVLDKRSAASFGLDDMELLGLFARPAAIAVEQARMMNGIGALMVQELGRLAEARADDDVARAAKAVLAEDAAASDQMLELARIVHTLSRRGERARQLAIDILSSLLRYTSP